MSKDLEELKTFVGERFDKLAESVQSNANTSLAAHEEHRKAFSQLRSITTKLWIKVHGSDPPPPTGTSTPPSVPDQEGTPTPPLLTAISDHGMEISALHASNIVLNDKVQAVESKVDTILEVNQRQTHNMGIGTSGWAFLATPEGKRFALSAITALTTLITAAGAAYAVMTGRLPSPVSPVPISYAAPPPYVPRAPREPRDLPPLPPALPSPSVSASVPKP